jgi:hypothetical protein
VRLDHNFVFDDLAKEVVKDKALMHAETLRDVGRSKLPFAGYSVHYGPWAMVDPPKRRLRRVELFEIAWDDPDFARSAS